MGRSAYLGDPPTAPLRVPSRRLSEAHARTTGAPAH